jgi:hypothetical protein
LTRTGVHFAGKRYAIWPALSSRAPQGVKNHGSKGFLRSKHARNEESLKLLVLTRFGREPLPTSLENASDRERRTYRGEGRFRQGFVCCGQPPRERLFESYFRALARNLRGGRPYKGRIRRRYREPASIWRAASGAGAV